MSAPAQEQVRTLYDSLGVSGSFLSESQVNREIRKLEEADEAVRTAVRVRIARNAKGTEEEKREQALIEVMRENPIFANAVNARLAEMLRNE
jgi:hypothetical protein